MKTVADGQHTLLTETCKQETFIYFHFKACAHVAKEYVLLFTLSYLLDQTRKLLLVCQALAPAVSLPRNPLQLLLLCRPLRTPCPKQQLQHCVNINSIVTVAACCACDGCSQAGNLCAGRHGCRLQDLRAVAGQQTFGAHAG